MIFTRDDQQETEDGGQDVTVGGEQQDIADFEADSSGAERGELQYEAGTASGSALDELLDPLQSLALLSQFTLIPTRGRRFLGKHEDFKVTFSVLPQKFTTPQNQRTPVQRLQQHGILYSTEISSHSMVLIAGNAKPKRW